MKEIVSLALCQPRVGMDKAANLAAARQLIDRAAGEGGEIVVLPEMFTGPYDAARFGELAEDMDGPTLGMLREAAQRNRCTLIGGSFPERAERQRITNSCFILGPRGDVLAVHRKLHLFDVELTAGVSFRESSTLVPGHDKTLFRHGDMMVGVGICYDIRFPEYARLLALEGAELIVYPGAFNPVTGPAHWELLLRARAVDNQVYTAGVSAVPGEHVGYLSYGHSLAADPWGRVLASAGEDVGVVHVQVSREEVRRIRQELPLLRHRRTDLYSLKGVGSWRGAGDGA